MDRAGLTARLGELGHPFEPGAGPGELPVVAVRSAQQAADLLGACTREGWRARLQGGGTRGRPPAGTDLVVSTRALAGFDVYEPDDLTAGLLAGTTHRAMAAELARHQQFLMLDPPASPAATIGGSFASGQAGPLRAGYGTPRDLALGVTLVTGDGRLLRLGGQVVKNVAGYDLVRLVVGSRGTLGLITQLHVRLRSIPQSDVTILADLPDPDAAAAAALALRDATGPVALELITRDWTAGRWHVAARLHGSADGTADAADRAVRLLPGPTRLAADAAASFWAGLATAEAEAPVRFRLRALPGHLPVLLRAADRLVKSWSDNESGAWAGAAHAADGELRAWWAGARPPAAGIAQALATEIRELVGTVNGTCICDCGPESVRALFPAPDPGPRVRQLERELRLRFDPGQVLAGD